MLILIQTDSKNLIPKDVTQAQANELATKFPIWYVNTDGSKVGPFGPTGPGVLTKGGYEALKAPSGFRWQNAPINVYKSGSKYYHDYDLSWAFPTDDTDTWFVDPFNGNDGTGVLGDRTKPLLNQATALAKSTGSYIEWINLKSNYVARSTKSFNNIQSTRSFVTLNRTGKRVISASTGSSVAPTWTRDSTDPSIWFAPFSASNSACVTDASIEKLPNAAGGEYIPPNAPQYFAAYVKKTAKSDVVAGTFYNDGTNTYLKTHDGRPPDANILVTNGVNNGRFPAVNGIVMGAYGIDFVGGNPFFATLGAQFTATGGAVGTSTITTASTTGVVVGMGIGGAGIQAGTTVISLIANTSVTFSAPLTATATGTYNVWYSGCVFKHAYCTFQGGAQNGLGIQGRMEVYGFRSAAYFNNRDGLNYHSFEADGTNNGTSPSIIEVECGAYGNGTTGSVGVSDNGSTSHDGCNVIRINGWYMDSDDRVVVDVGFAQSWNVGGYVGQTRGNSENVAALDSAKIWLDGVAFGYGINYPIVAGQSASIRYSNMPAISNNTTSEATGSFWYVPA